MNFKSVCTEMIRASNQNLGKQARINTNYRFEFLGVSSPERRQICYPFHVEAYEADEDLDREFISICWQQTYREFQYIALDYLIVFKNKLEPEDFDFLCELLPQKAWWDTFSVMAKIFGFLLLKYPFLIRKMAKLLDNQDEWLRALVVSYQIDFTSKTNLPLFNKALRKLMHDDSKICRRAVVRALLNYANFNPIWVKNFIEENLDDLPDEFIIEFDLLFAKLGSKLLAEAADKIRESEEASVEDLADAATGFGVGLYAMQQKLKPDYVKRKSSIESDGILSDNSVLTGDSETGAISRRSQRTGVSKQKRSQVLSAALASGADIDIDALEEAAELEALGVSQSSGVIKNDSSRSGKASKAPETTAATSAASAAANAKREEIKKRREEVETVTDKPVFKKIYNVELFQYEKDNFDYLSRHLLLFPECEKSAEFIEELRNPTEDPAADLENQLLTGIQTGLKNE